MAQQRQGSVAQTDPSASVHARRDPSVRIVLAALTLAGFAAGVWFVPVTQRPHPVSDLHLLWPAMAVLAGLAELAVIHVHTRREAHAISLGELALICGLYFAAPGGLVVGRCVGALLVFAFWRRQSGLKLAFNGALNAAESCLALLVFHSVDGTAHIGPQAWVATLAATAAAAVLSAGAVSTVIAIVEGGPPGRELIQETLRGVVTASTTSVIGLVAVHALTQSPFAAAPLTVCLVVLLAGYRRYAWLWERHLGLERLHRSNQALQSSPGVDDALLAALHQTRDVARAEHSEIVFLSADAQRATVCVDIDADRLRRTRMHTEQAEDHLWAELADGRPVVVLSLIHI